MYIDDMNREEIKQFADSLETSFVIIDEICNMCEKTHEVREIWEDPTSEQKSAIMEIAWANTEDDELHWGEETIKRPVDEVDVEEEVHADIDRMTEYCTSVDQCITDIRELKKDVAAQSIRMTSLENDTAKLLTKIDELLEEVNRG